MRYAFSPEQQAFGESATDLFARHCSPGAQRLSWTDDSGRDPSLWRGVVDLGAPAILVSEEYDGFAGTECDLLPVLEEAGRQAVPDALLESVFVGPFALVACGSEDQRRRWLPAIASGESRVTIALSEGGLVPDAHVSDLIVLARDGQLRIHEAGEVALERVHVEDPSRRLFQVTPRTEGELLPASGDLRDQVVARELVGSAAVLNGIASHLLSATVAYAKERQQFGRLIGSFQGVKHLLADAFSKVELATTAARAATWRVAAADPEGLASARLARICAVEAEFVANKVALQVHGGIGFTFEHDLQLWLKRGKALEQSHGGRHRVARLGGLDAVASAQRDPQNEEDD
ncbi:acyl-CoA dehydrogenase domain protein [Serinicoccus hydrothermalis]|uniref:Acyl-CoA dehydrogenase domain protein n=1 Tax=Serinicoccus hydrothermalis TaxID=1758689 RepID=A0A1B1NF87_9MICO|nr:acyl-CoA dehydrogenase family protein [Serinicoccus hydrothermalis]ANS80063.1 acyl-CoA dehydrogenase domain protein [Serinicoccus hydrothermalis]